MIAEMFVDWPGVPLGNAGRKGVIVMLDHASARFCADYINLVESSALSKNGDAFLNGSLAHAAVIVQHIIVEAYRSVSILSHSLDPRIYGRNRTLDATSRFLDEVPRRMRILMEEGDESVHAENPFLNKFKNHPNMEIRIVPPSFQEKYKLHLIVADSESYRYKPDKTKSMAIVAFGHKKGATNLERIFETLWKRCARDKVLPRVH